MKEQGKSILNKEIPILYSQNEECCGCSACFAICPRSAISMTENEEGFLYPIIDQRVCIRCYQCIQVCHFKTQFKLPHE